MSQTIDKIFLSHAEKQGDNPALTDTKGRQRLGLSTIEQLTYRQAKRYVTAAAAYFRQFQFSEGDIVIVQMPNIAETHLIMLALLNAGLVPCPIPTHWRRAEIDPALKKLKPRAIISHQSSPDNDPFQSMFEVAANHASIRFIFGLGDNLPDGVSPLPPLVENITTDHEPENQPSVVFSRSSEQLAFIGWSRDNEGHASPVAYTHIQLMANHHIVSEQVNLEGRPNLLSFYAPTGLNGMVTTFLPWVIEGGTLHIAAKLKLSDLKERIEKYQINLAVIPQAIENKFINALKTAELDQQALPHLMLISPTPYHKEHTGVIDETEHSAINKTTIYNLNGLCLFPQSDNAAIQFQKELPADLHPSTSKGLLHLGPQRSANSEIEAAPSPAFIETRIQGAAQKAGESDEHESLNTATTNLLNASVLKGRLEISGLAVGFTNWQSNMTTIPLSNFDTHWEKTYLSAALIDQAMSLVKILPARDAIYYGSTQLEGKELDEIYQTYPGFVDAAAFSIKDPVLGERLYAAIIPKPGTALSYEDFKQHLLEQHISPAKIPEKLVTVFEIPRTEDGHIKRQEILNQSA